MRAPQRGLIATKAVNGYVYEHVHVDVFSNPTKERSTLPIMSNSYCHSGRAGGSPNGLGARKNQHARPGGLEIIAGGETQVGGKIKMEALAGATEYAEIS